MHKIIQILLLVVLLSVSILAGIMLYNQLTSIEVTGSIPSSGAQISPYGALTFTFSHPVQPELIEALFHNEPEVAGTWKWIDERTGRWTASSPLPLDTTIVIEFQSGTAGKKGESIRHSIRWEAQVRQPQILVLQDTDDGQEIFAYPLTPGADGTRLSFTGGSVNNFAPSPDGEQTLFSTSNNHGGSDLWIMQRDGSNARRLLECGSEWCDAPVWSPTTDEIAYTRKKPPTEMEGNTTVWIVDSSSGETSTLFSDPEKSADDPIWSPDGKWIATWNRDTNQIQVTQRGTGKTILLESSNGDSGCWSPDSRYLYYAHIASGVATFRNLILVADIDNGSIVTVLNNSVKDDATETPSIDSPVCSPTEDWIALRIQPNIRIAGKKLVALNLNAVRNHIEMGTIEKDTTLKDIVEISTADNFTTVMDDLTKIPAYPSWSPTGDRLVFQLNPLSNDHKDIEIWVWDQQSKTAEMVISGARFPQWLP